MPDSASRSSRAIGRGCERSPSGCSGRRQRRTTRSRRAWLRLSRSDTGQVENLGGWLTTVVGRVCLDMLRSRRTRREEPLEPDVRAASSDNPEHEAVLADSLGIALLVVLETLTPAERVAFVLHDMFAMPFDEIATIVGRSEAATRQLASRARRRVQGGGVPDADLARRREVVDAFLAASRGGDFQALLTLLDPDSVARSDGAAVLMGADREARGARAVAQTFAGRARFAQTAIIDGDPGLVWMQAGKTRVVFSFTIKGGKIVAIDLIADQERIRDLDLA